jgi:hypothetical protein
LEMNRNGVVAAMLARFRNGKLAKPSPGGDFGHPVSPVLQIFERAGVGKVSEIVDRNSIFGATRSYRLYNICPGLKGLLVLQEVNQLSEKDSDGNRSPV